MYRSSHHWNTSFVFFFVDYEIVEIVVKCSKFVNRATTTLLLRDMNPTGDEWSPLPIDFQIHHWPQNVAIFPNHQSRWWIIGHVIIIIIICIDTSWWVVSQLPHCGSRCYHLLHRHALYLRCTFRKNLENIHSMCKLHYILWNNTLHRP